MKTIACEIQSEEGLHARPAADFCEVASTFDSEITVQKQGKDEAFNGKSIISILCLGAVKGETVIVTANGNDEEQAITALAEVLAKG
ncbi:MAG TPA: HPr family phosphocarrier protein [Clostridiales bacterium]|nr:HPr family phosphocarrier protein [Clostridiales bacterium]